MYKKYFVTYFLYIVRQYVRWKLKEKVDTLIHFCFFSRVRVYTIKLVKVATFLYTFTPQCFAFSMNVSTIFSVPLCHCKDVKIVKGTC